MSWGASPDSWRHLDFSNPASGESCWVQTDSQNAVQARGGIAGMGFSVPRQPRTGPDAPRPVRQQPVAQMRAVTSPVITTCGCTCERTKNGRTRWPPVMRCVVVSFLCLRRRPMFAGDVCRSRTDPVRRCRTGRWSLVRGWTESAATAMRMTLQTFRCLQS